MTCPKCGRHFEAAASFCTFCGVALFATTSTPATVAPAAQVPSRPAQVPVHQARAVVAHPGHQPYVPHPIAVQSSQYSTAAIVAFVFGLILFSLPAVICGHVARRNIKRFGMRGNGLAIAGLVFGYLTLPFTLLFWVAVVFSFGGYRG